MAEFDPNRNSMAACLELVARMQEEMGIDKSRIFTSKDTPNLWDSRSAAVANVPGGFNKIMLPFYTDGPATFYISAAGPSVRVPRHSHKEGDGIRFIIGGSIIFDDQELVAGDWMFMPAGAEYEFTVGPRGVIMCYCYCCCCA